MSVCLVLLPETQLSIRNLVWVYKLDEYSSDMGRTFTRISDVLLAVLKSAIVHRVLILRNWIKLS